MPLQLQEKIVVDTSSISWITITRADYAPEHTVDIVSMRRIRPMLSVCLCGSFRFYDEMVALRHGLDARGIICEWPMPGARRDPQAMSPDEARDAITRHLERIDRADLVFVFDPGGYVGNSVAVEIGYAYARRKSIYLLAPLHDPFLMSLVTAVVSLGDLMQLVQA